MASAFSHAFVAVAMGTAYARESMPWKFWALSVLCAVLPDADVISFAWGVRYESMWGHRGLSHSLCFAFLLSLGVLGLVWRDGAPGSPQWWAAVLYFFVVTASHGYSMPCYALQCASIDAGKGLLFLWSNDKGALHYG